MTGTLVGLLCAATWAFGSVTLRDLGKKLDPFTLNASRSVVAALATLAAALTIGGTGAYRALTPEKLFFLLASVALGGVIGDSCHVVGLSRMGVSRAFPIASTYPAVVLVLSLVFLHERVDAAILSGLGLVLGGILLMGKPSLTSQGEQAGSPRASGAPYALLASLSWGASTVLVAPGIEGLDTLMAASIRTPALSLMLWVIVALRGTFSDLFTLSAKEWGILIAGGLVGWGLGSLLFLLSISLAGPTRAAIYTATSPLFALPISIVFLKERPNLTVLIGTALTVGGIVLVSL